MQKITKMVGPRKINKALEALEQSGRVPTSLLEEVIAVLTDES